MEPTSNKTENSESGALRGAHSSDKTAEEQWSKNVLNNSTMTGKSCKVTGPSIGTEAGADKPAFSKKRKADSQLAPESTDDASLHEDTGMAGKGGLVISDGMRMKNSAALSRDSLQSNAAAPVLPPATNSLLSTKDDDSTGSSARVFGAGSTYSGFGSAVASSASTKASGFAGLLSAHGNGSSLSLGFGTSTLPAQARDATSVSTTVFGSSSGYTTGGFGGSTPGASAGGPGSASVVTLPEHVELTTGEEDETNILAVRCKSYKWVVEENKAETEVPCSSHSARKESSYSSPPLDYMKTPSHPSVPPSANFNEENFNEGSSKVSEKTLGSNRGDTPSHRWQELGIGPMKLLRESPPTCPIEPISMASMPDAFASTRVRLVQRRESAPNGPATKVILNVPLWKESTHAKSSERHISLTTLNETGMGETYLFKFKTSTEANLFSSKLTEVIAVAKSCVKQSV